MSHGRHQQEWKVEGETMSHRDRGRQAGSWDPDPDPGGRCTRVLCGLESGEGFHVGGVARFLVWVLVA